MKIKRYKANSMPINPSPITKNGRMVYRRLEVENDPLDPSNPWHIEYTPGKEEAVRVLSFLNDNNGIRWTSKLAAIERDLRDELYDLMSVDLQDD